MAPEVEFVRAVEEFLMYCRKNGWTPCFYEAAESRLPVYHSVGLRSLKIAEEALIDLPEFGLAGGARANLRAMVNKVAKTGAAIRQYDRQVLIRMLFSTNSWKRFLRSGWKRKN